MVNGRSFLERPDGVAFWTMILVGFAFLMYSYAIAQTVDWFLLFVLIVAGLVFSVVWGIFAWRRPWSVEMEKVEWISFWIMSLISLTVLTLYYATANFFNYYVFYVFVAGLLTKYVVHFFVFRRKS